MKYSQKILVLVVILTLLWSSNPRISFSQTNDTRVLFVVENTADNELAQLIAQKGNFSYDVIDIKPKDDLNQALDKEHFENYQVIMMIINQLSTPFNNSMVTSITDFINSGNIFGIVTTQLWRFSSSFQHLLGIDPTQQGQKEFPQGNVSTNLDYVITNDTLTKYPFEFINGSSFQVESAIGISNSIKTSYRVAKSEETAHGHTEINAFRKNAGFVIAAPMSPVEVSSSLGVLAEFLTSILFYSIDSVIVDLPTTNTQNLSTSTTTSPNFIRPKLQLNEVGNIIAFGSFTLVLLAFAYFVAKKILSPNISIEISDVPKDKSWISSLFLTPILFIGQILYPPILRRISDYDVLSNEYRLRIVKLLEEKDFLHFRELKRELGIGTSSLRWHLQVLEDFRVIDRKVFGQYEIYYLLRNVPDPDLIKLYFAMISTGGYRIAKAFNQVQTWTLSNLAEYTGSSQNALRYHVQKFEKLDFLEINGEKYTFNPNKIELLKLALERRKKTN